MHKIKYALFYDFHTSPLHPDVGKEFDAEKITDRFVECGIDYVTFHARCNMGMAYYNTKIGTRHPSLNFDLFGELAEACQRKKIAIGAYFNGGLSRYEGVKHRDWTTIFPDGTQHHQPFWSPFSQTMCYNSPYREHLKAMVREVAENYPVSGFFFDCMSAWDCVCPHCIEKMRAEGVDFNSQTERRAFAQKTQREFAEELGETARSYDPEYLIYFNDVHFEDQKNAGSYLEFECLPCKSGGYQFMNVAPHYMRTLGKPGVHMTGRFNRWSDFGGIRNAHTLKYELFFALANGLRPNIGDHLSPDGKISETVFDRCKEVFGALHKYDRWFDDSSAEADAAIVWHNGGEIRLSKVISGTVRMLSEMNMQFDIVSPAVSWEKYSLLIFPDGVRLDGNMRRKIREHVAKGGYLFVSGRSGLDENNTFPVEWGVEFESDAAFTPAYFTNAPGDGRGDLTYSFYEEACQVKPLEGSQTLYHLVAPALNREWDGLYPEYYNPPFKKSSYPFISCRGKSAYCSGKIFTGYADMAPVPVREAMKETLELMGWSSMLKVKGAPSFVKFFAGHSKEGKMVSMLAYLPEKRGAEMETVEDELTAGNFELSLKCPGGVRRVYMAPEEKELSFRQEGEYITVTVPEFTGFSMVVFE